MKNITLFVHQKGKCQKARLFLICLSTVIVAFFFNIDKSLALPSYARQTGLSCTACHTAFPELNSFGRQFKLDGYTMTTTPTIEANDSTINKLSLLASSPISAMVQTSYSSVNTKVPGQQNKNIDFPQQLSLFYAGEVTRHIGTFIQITYDSQSGAIGMDNADIRYSNHANLLKKDWLYGFTLNNNPTVQDVWNTVPAWRYPYASSSAAPSPDAATQIEGGMTQPVAGLGTYGLFNHLLYYEVSFYRSAPNGLGMPPPDSIDNVISGVAPYWRLALQHQFGKHYLMIGTYGMSSNVFPHNNSGVVNKYSDVGIDLQYEYMLPRTTFTLHSSFIQEKRNFDASFVTDGGADNASSKLNSFKIDGNVYLNKTIGFTLGYFNMKGDMDAKLYQSFTGKPDSRGTLMEVSYYPWYNTRFSVQYVMYNKFNGQATNYDGNNRDARQNNTLYCLAWISF